jgi:hypothetical protein
MKLSAIVSPASAHTARLKPPSCFGGALTVLHGAGEETLVSTASTTPEPETVPATPLTATYPFEAGPLTEIEDPDAGDEDDPPQPPIVSPTTVAITKAIGAKAIRRVATFTTDLPSPHPPHFVYR